MEEIRIATIADRTVINRITEEFSDHEYSHSASYFEESLLTQKIILATFDKKIVGYLIFHIIWGNTPYIELLRVSKKYQRKGIGAELLRELEKKLKADGYKVLISSSERINEIGNAFHQKLGFETIGQLDMIYGKEIFYKKKLL